MELTLTAPSSKHGSDSDIIVVDFFGNASSNSTQHKISTQVLGYFSLLGNTLCMVRSTDPTILPFSLYINVQFRQFMCSFKSASSSILRTVNLLLGLRCWIIPCGYSLLRQMEKVSYICDCIWLLLWCALHGLKQHVLCSERSDTFI